MLCNKILHLFCLVFVITVVAGCATMSGASDGRSTALERSYKKCGVALVGSSVAGVLIAIVTGKDTGKGAIAGAAVGGAACAVMFALEAKEDRERMMALQKRAAASGQSRNDQFTTVDGKVAKVSTGVSSAEVASDRYSVCRYVDQTAEVNQKQADIDPQLWCRVASNGNWEPATQPA